MDVLVMIPLVVWRGEASSLEMAVIGLVFGSLGFLVHLDATSHGIGWVRGGTHQPNLPAIVWGVFCLSIPPIGLLVYFYHREALVEFAKQNPVPATWFTYVVRVAFFGFALLSASVWGGRQSSIGCSHPSVVTSLRGAIEGRLHRDVGRVVDVHFKPGRPRASEGRCEATVSVDSVEHRVSYDIEQRGPGAYFAIVVSVTDPLEPVVSP